MSELYYTFRNNGDFLTNKLQKLKNAAHDLLGHDGHKFEIREDAEGWFRLFVSASSTNTYGGAGEFGEWTDYYARTEEELYKNIIKLGGVHSAYAKTEKEYKDFLKQIGE
jgi:hypothetical protein